MIKSTIDVAGYWSIVLFVDIDYDEHHIGGRYDYRSGGSSRSRM